MKKKKPKKLSKFDIMMKKISYIFLVLLIPISYLWCYLFDKNTEINELWLFMPNCIWLIIFAFIYLFTAFEPYSEDD